MRPDTALDQLEYAVAPRLGTDRFGHWERAVYADVFEDLAARGTKADVHTLVRRLADEFEDGRRPRPEQARRYADSLLTADGRALTDGGE